MKNLELELQHFMFCYWTILVSVFELLFWTSKKDVFKFYHFCQISIFYHVLKRFLFTFIYCSFLWLHPDIIYLMWAVSQTFWNEHNWAYFLCDHHIVWKSPSTEQFSPEILCCHWWKSPLPQYDHFPAFGVPISISVWAVCTLYQLRSFTHCHAFPLLIHPWYQNMTSLWHKGNESLCPFQI